MDDEEVPGPYELGRLRERIDNMQRQFTNHQQATEVRFNRVEDKIAAGFSQSHADREAGNKTIGDMITNLQKKVEAQAEIIARGQGSISLGANIINFIGVLCGGAFVGAIAHIFH